MSLIPSESASFPDLLGRLPSGWKRSNGRSLPSPPYPQGAVKQEAPSSPPPARRDAAPTADTQKKSNGSNQTPIAPKPASSSGPVVEKPGPPISPPRALPKKPAPAYDPSQHGGAEFDHPRSAASRPRTPCRKPLAPPSDVEAQRTNRSAPAPAVQRARTPLSPPRSRPQPKLEPREPLRPASLPPRAKSHFNSPPSPQTALLPFAESGDAMEKDPMFDETSTWRTLQRRHRGKLLRFLGFELLALSLLGFSVAFGLAHRLPDDPLSVIAKVAAIVTAIAAAIVPILFYGLPETLPRNRR